MTVAKATRLSRGRPSQQATVWRAWASSFTRLWEPAAARANCALAIPPHPARNSRRHFRLPRSARACWTVAAGSRAAPLLPLAPPGPTSSNASSPSCAASTTHILAPPDNARENGNYAGIRCSQKRAIMLALCSDYAAYKPAYKMKFTYRFTYILISTGFLCGYERHRPNSISGSRIYFPVKNPRPTHSCVPE